jgi:hypothetical protein
MHTKRFHVPPVLLVPHAVNLGSYSLNSIIRDVGSWRVLMVTGHTWLTWTSSATTRKLTCDAFEQCVGSERRTNGLCPSYDSLLILQTFIRFPFISVQRGDGSVKLGRSINSSRPQYHFHLKNLSLLLVPILFYLLLDALSSLSTLLFWDHSPNDHEVTEVDNWLRG